MTIMTETPSALDVSLELVATKNALSTIIEGLPPTGTTYTETDWANETPVPLPTDEASQDRMLHRATVIEAEIWEGIARYALARAAHLRRISASELA